MENYQELYHWGIKGQKWGIRRYQNEDGTLTEAGKKRYYYQNPDGSLTEEGKKHYMEAARKGKLNPKKLSDADLNMINARFAKEKAYNENIKKYQESQFSYKLKEALISRIKGNGGGGGGKKGGSGIASLLASPIKKAFEDALKFDAKKAKLDYSKEDAERAEAKKAKQMRDNGYRFVEKYVSETNKEQTIKSLRYKDIEDGKSFIGRGKPKMHVDKSAIDRFGITDTTRTGTSAAEERLRARRAAREAEREAEREKERAKSAEAKRQRKRAAELRREKNLEERLGKSGLILGHSDECLFIITRDSSDELKHWGIKGQKWGVRRFENPDGTLTAEGKIRYGSGSSEDRHPNMDYRNSKEVSDYIRDTVQKSYHDAARNEAVWKKHGLGQDTVGQFVEQKKYGDMVKHIDSATEKIKDEAVKAAHEATKSKKENWSKPGPLWENSARKDVEYWDKLKEVADEYISKNFSSADQEVARGVIYWWYIDW